MLGLVERRIPFELALNDRTSTASGNGHQRCPPPPSASRPPASAMQTICL